MGICNLKDNNYVRPGADILSFYFVLLLLYHSE